MKLSARALRPSALVALLALLSTSPAPARAAEPARGAGPIGNWAAVHQSAEARSGHTATLLATGEVLVAGGSTAGVALASAELYDPASGLWRNAAPMSRPRVGHTATLLRSGRVLVVGGSDAGDTGELYDPTSNTWTPTPASGAIRSLHTATLLDDGTVLVTGGRGAFGDLASAQIFDPGSNTWSNAGAMGHARAAHAAVGLADGSVLVAGGRAGAALDSAERFDPTTRRWRTVAPMSTARADFAAVRLGDGRVLAEGGALDASGGALATAELFDPATATWTTTASMAAARRAHTATVLADGSVLVAGGASATAEPSAASERFDPSTGTWAPAGAMMMTRASHTATLVASGGVLVAGGDVGAGGSTATAERFDAIGGLWTTVAPMPQPRFGHTLTTLSDGRVLATGGFLALPGGDTLQLDSCEIYDPVTNAWTPAASMPEARSYHYAILLRDGRVLVVGGVPNFLSPGDTFLYDPATNMWTSSPMTGGPRYYAQPALLGDGRVLVSGGESAQNRTRDDAAVFDPASGSWSPVASMNRPRQIHTLTSLRDGRVLAVGGRAINENTPPDAEVYDPATNRWTLTTAFANVVSLAFHTATPLADGRVLVAGGDASQVITEAYLFDPATSSWTPTGAPSTDRVLHAAAPLPNGRVLVFGGQLYGGQAPAPAEVYDPETEAWTRVADLSVWRRDFIHLSSAVLLDGRVFISGGASPNFPTASSEAYAAAPLAAAPSRPVIVRADAQLPIGARVIVSGTGFDAPALELRSLATGEVRTLGLDPISGSSATCFTSTPLAAFPLGAATLTMLSGSSRSIPRLVEVTDGRACAFDLAAESASVGADGGGVVVVVTTTDDCVWAATSRAPFLTVQSPNAGSGSGAVSVLVGANAGPARMGAIAVAGRTLVVSQDAGPSVCAPIARPLKPAKTAKGALDGTDCFEPGFGAHYADAFVVDAKAGRAYVFTVKASFEAVVDVADASGIIVASAMGPVARVTVSTLQGGPLFVYVSGTEPLATGSYKVKVAQRRATSR